jgi:hypothetical protein
MIFIFFGILATIAVGSMIYAVYKIVQDSRLIRRLQLRRDKDIIELVKEISTCIKELKNDNNSKTLETLRGLLRYLKKYY